MIDQMIQQGIMVDHIITDPPYNISRENNFQSINRSGIDFGEWDKNFDQVSWLNKINKIVKPGGSVIIFNDWRNLGLIADKLEENNFEIKDILRWEKTNPMPRNVTRRYVTDYEFAIWATLKKGKWTFNKPENIPYLKPSFKHSIVSGINRIHPTEKSLNLIKEIINIHTNEHDTIFDPFSGSGTISLAAKQLNRNYIGCEIAKTYYLKSLKRLGRNDFIKPLFNHLGNKYRLLKEISTIFPQKKVNTFIDVFAGSGVVTMNYLTPNHYLFNDKDSWIIKLFKWLKNSNINIVLKKIESIIKHYNLPTESNLCSDYKNAYNSLKDDFNKKKEIGEFFVLLLFGFNQQIRFNSNGNWNVPKGKFVWNEYQKRKLTSFCEHLKKIDVTFYNLDFEDFVYKTIPIIDKDRTVLYFDPPYLISNATYNSNWNDNDENRLLKLLSFLTEHKYKWVLSNVIGSKQKTNDHLKVFLKTHKHLKVVKIPNITYKNSNYQRKNKDVQDEEILVMGNL